MVSKVLITMSLMVLGALAQFNPILEVTSCTRSKLELTLTDGADGGIIYIQGQGAACRQLTTSGVSYYTIDFGSCGIQWEESFKVIVQKKSLYQTGDDKQIPVMCIADLGDLTVSNSLDVADKDDDAGLNKTVKPTATMTLYSNGENINGGTVKLTDIVTLVMQLDAEYIEDFDIKAKSCFADNIEIISNACPVDTELFPHINSISQGLIQAQFGAFRTTSLAGGSVSMPFSCTLQVCLGSCSYTTCSDGFVSYGRKKRALAKRQAEENNMEDISVGSSISITTDEVTIESPDDDNNTCMNSAAFAALMTVLTAGMVSSFGAFVVVFRKFMDNKRVLMHLNSKG
ncbi:uncharacterized protein LOC132756671 isoform X2 [Ruditapes philippinarum]|uniref:uncharacterized protein LOC132756671 isoform X2 n=1 Tax=Ruditapes philippinarum TaxID=129788 RepID=UPI00295AC7E6|nr:uncharacterized protein LOC132756671 isoform X2 [Ruditapes philippinarum]